MKNTPEKMSRLLAPLQRIGRRLHRDQRGTALTEFVICLPVFVLIFVGVVNLNRLQQESLSVKIKATDNLWAAAIPVQKSNFSTRMLPSVEGGKAAAHIGSHFRYMIADPIGIASGTGLAATGHFGESYWVTKPVDTMANIWGSSGHTLTAQGKNVYDNMEYTRDIVDDGLLKPKPSGSGLLGQLNNLITLSGARPAIAAGIRYGLAVGEAEGTVSLANQSYTVSAGYDVLVAPKPTSEYMTTAVTRLAAESYKPFRGVLGIEWSSRL